MLQTILIITALLNIGEAPTDYKVDPKASKVAWKGEKVTGGHTGTIQLKEGTIILDEGKLTGGTFTIDMTTIDSDEDLSKLEGHLKSDDFFGVEKFPTSTFTITEVVDQGPRGYNVTGDITIKGITKEIEFDAKVEDTDKGIKATAEIELDRSEFDVKYGSGSFFDGLGDKLIYDDFNLTIELVASK